MSSNPQDASEEEPYSRGRLHSYLLEHSHTYRDLQDEQVRGWNSPALDWWYNRHKVTSTNPNTAAAVASTIGEKRPREATSDAHSADGTTTNVADGIKRDTVFKTNTVALCERYRAHASRILPSADPLTFRPVFVQRGRNVGMRPVTPLEPPRTVGKYFLDLGCAPGGVSAFMTQNCGWTGIGVTLGEGQGGIELPPWSGGAAAVTNNFRAIYDSIFSAHLNLKISTSLAELLPTAGGVTHVAVDGAAFDFVNGGAVADFGQQSTDEVSPLEVEFADAFFAKPPSHPKHLFLFAQLLIALRWVKPGGSIMLVVGLGEVGSLLVMLHNLLPMLGGDSTVQLLETMHLMKPPVYVLISSIHPTSEAVAALHDKIRSTENRDYWLGNTDDSFEVAKQMWSWPSTTATVAASGVSGSSRRQVPIGQQIEALWVKKRALLAERRQQAEAQYNKVGRA